MTSDARTCGSVCGTEVAPGSSQAARRPHQWRHSARADPSGAARPLLVVALPGQSSPIGSPVTTKKSKRPSGPSGKHLGVPILLRASSNEQKERWERAAEKARRNLSDWIRVTLDDASGGG